MQLPYEIIDSSYHVIRRISKHHIVPDNNKQKERLSSVVFKSKNVLSVDVKEMIQADGNDPISYTSTNGWIGSLLLNVGEVGKRGDMLVRLASLPDNPYHAEIFSESNGIKSAQCKYLFSIATWFSAIKGVEIS